MSESLRDAACRLLQAGTVKVVIGHGPGSADRTRPVFARRPDEVPEFACNGHRGQNLAVYLLKPEVRALGKPAVVARPAELRSILQFAAESQLPDEAVVALTAGSDGGVKELPTLGAIEEHLASLPRGAPAGAQEEHARLAAMPREQRWTFWSGELARCIKCYACRAACPSCYCSRCIVDCNQPQWIPVPADGLGNLEWNVVRAMHLVGRCIGCDSCAEACPQGIRLDLLNRVLATEAQASFGAEPGYSRRKEYALAAFKPDDKETFIR
jgi:ferredoxin